MRKFWDERARVARERASKAHTAVVTAAVTAAVPGP
jgi:hypothetical protein